VPYFQYSLNVFRLGGANILCAHAQSKNYPKFHNFDAMPFVRTLFLYMSITFAIFLLIGLVKPWIMLWWEDVQNRRKVLKLYGVIAIVSYGIHWILGMLI
jgi:hypothetical protein